jgi:predicted Fe-Mo cluster-binding NifX family protein
LQRVIYKIKVLYEPFKEFKMIAIPLARNESTVISSFYGNSPYFAFLNEETGTFKVVENKGCGDGMETAKFISEQKIDSTIFYHMGEGIYNFFQENGLKVYSCARNFLSIDQIYIQFLGHKCKEVTKSNSSALLDSGTSSSACACSSK